VSNREADAPTLGDTLLRASGVVKAFGATQALRNGSFELAAGEVHVLAGENGSGKSTLVKILSGVQAADAGSFWWPGSSASSGRVSSPLTPRAVRALGLATVFQEVRVADSRSVLDNVWLGHEGLIRSRASAKEKERLAHDEFMKLLDFCPDLRAAAGTLSFSERQACLIVRALLHKPRILILDEATASLDFDSRRRLGRILEDLTGAGTGVVFISHRVDEMSDVGDRVTVMRSGETVGTLTRGTWRVADLVGMMTGVDQAGPGSDSAKSKSAPERARLGSPVLTAKSIVLKAGCRPLDLEIRSGEIIGIAGLEGHGQSELLHALRGGRANSGQVLRRQDGKETPIRSVRGSAALGVAYVSGARGTSLFEWMSIRENFGMPTLRRDSRLGWLEPRLTRRRLRGFVDELRIVANDTENRITSLSGGNQQKVLLARWLAAAPKVLILNDPTRGIDIGAKREFYTVLRRLLADGIAIVMASSDLDEHVGLMDRVLVFREYELSTEISHELLTRTNLVAAFFGQEIVA
jgi:ABC-type sugar transport system ATPase subunit